MKNPFGDIAKSIKSKSEPDFSYRRYEQLETTNIVNNDNKKSQQAVSPNSEEPTNSVNVEIESNYGSINQQTRSHHQHTYTGDGQSITGSITSPRSEMFSFASWQQNKNILQCLFGTCLIIGAVLCLIILFEDGETPIKPMRYDYIVVGGGPAGSLLAKRLSDNPLKRVLLLEAGGESQTSLGGEATINGELNNFDIPLMWTSVAHNPKVHWKIDDALIAKVLGGCGMHNAMLYVRALKEDFEKWNITGWNWDETLNNYKAMEKFKGKTFQDFHGYDGPIVTSPPEYVDEISPYFIQSCLANNLTLTSDFNNPDGGRMGCGYYHFNINDGLRHSAASAFLSPIKNKRENLDIILNAEVTKVILEDPLGSEKEEYTYTYRAGKKIKKIATGVEYRKATSNKGGKKSGKNASRYETKVAYLNLVSGMGRGLDSSTKEIILTAGAINTPRILLSSGIGKSKYLKDIVNFKEEDIVDLQGVGENLQDHPGIGMSFEVSSKIAMKMPSGYLFSEDLQLYVNWVREQKHPQQNKKKKGDNMKRKDDDSNDDDSNDDDSNDDDEENSTSASKKLGVEIEIEGVGKEKVNTYTSWRASTNQTKGNEPFKFFASSGLTAGLFFSTGIDDLHKIDERGEVLLSDYLNKTTKPDIQLTIFPKVTEPHLVNRDKEKEDHNGKDTYNRNSMLVTVALLDPELTYSISLDDEQRGAKINRVNLVSERDIQKLLIAIKLVRKLQSTPPMDEVTIAEEVPGIEVQSDDELIDWIKSNLYTNSHWCCSSKMGSDLDPDTVLDNRLRVHGVDQLRVADASAIPNIPNGNVHSTVLLFANKCSTMIKEEDDLIKNNENKRDVFRL